jgi:hypothetical protein
MAGTRICIVFRAKEFGSEFINLGGTLCGSTRDGGMW